VSHDLKKFQTSYYSLRNILEPDLHIIQVELGLHKISFHFIHLTYNKFDTFEHSFPFHDCVPSFREKFVPILT
jgi:hypothetical protein